MAKNHNWDSHYAASEHLFSDEPDADLVKFANDLKPGRALDIGAGEGRNSIWLSCRGWDITAIDQSGVALERMKEMAQRKNCPVHTIKTDMLEYLALGNQFNLVILANIHPDPNERKKFFANIINSITPGGYLFVVGHHIDSLGKVGPHDPNRLYTEEILREALLGLEIQHLYKRDGAHGDTGKPSVDLIAWAKRP